MASRNLMIGTGAALAGLGGIAAAAVTTNAPETQPAPQTAAAPVETQTVIVRKVEHRVKRIRAKHPHRVAAAPAIAPVQAPAVAQPAAAPVVRAAPAPAANLRNATPIRTRASGGGHGTGGDDSGEVHHGSDDKGESHDD